MNLFHSFDIPVFHFINAELHHPVLNKVMWLITCFGLGYVQIIGVMLLSLSLSVRKSPQERAYSQELLWMSGLAFAFSGITSIVLKEAFKRGRPSTMFTQYLAPDEMIYNNSFPSGHTITSFAIAYAIAVVAKKRNVPWQGALALLLAFLVGVSRVYRGVHWPSDVIGAAILGVLTSAISCYLFQRFQKRTRTDVVVQTQENLPVPSAASEQD